MGVKLSISAQLWGLETGHLLPQIEYKSQRHHPQSSDISAVGSVLIVRNAVALPGAGRRWLLLAAYTRSVRERGLTLGEIDV